MKTTAVPAHVVAILLLVFLAGCTSLNQVTPSGMDDAAIEADVRAKIAAAIPGKTFDLGVAVDDGVVTLSGSVDSETDRRRIGDAARSVKGVRSVMNNLQLR